MWRRAAQHVLTAPLGAVCAVGTAVSIRPGTTLMEAAQTRKGYFSTLKRGQQCPPYGCPLLPRDVYYDPAVKEALAKLRTMKRDEVPDVFPTAKEGGEEEFAPLEPSGRKESGTLTLIGYKGGPMEAQINQDRAFCFSPYNVKNDGSQSRWPNSPFGKKKEESIQSRLLGVFDGHANLGENISQHVIANLPQVLADKMEGASGEPSKIKQALIDTFIEMDKTAPAEISGGCTATVVLQHGNKVYFANAGDSVSFLVVYRSRSRTVQVVYVTREDKPELPDERARVESMGGKVYLPLQGTSRVLYTDPETGIQSGLAMSRSIGDWEVGRLGVIPDPIVGVVDIPELVQSQLELETLPTETKAVDDVHIFAVSASDGMMDFATPEFIAHTVAASLYDEEGSHLLTGLEQLIYYAASGWEQSKQGRYRDDIAVAASEIRIPAKAPKQ